MRADRRIIALSIAAAVVVWVMHALVTGFAFHPAGHTFWDLLFTNVSARDFIARQVGTASVLLLGLVFSVVFARSKRAHEELQKERDRSQEYLHVAGVMILALDAGGEITLINDKGCEILGGGREDIIGRNWLDTFVPQRYRDETRAVLERLRAGDIESVEYREGPVVTLGGEERVIAWHNAAFADGDGGFAGVLCSGEDITERRRAEEALRQSERRYRLLAENMTDLVFVQDLDLNLIYISTSVATLYGYTVEEALRLRMEGLLTAKSLRKAEETFRERVAIAGTETHVDIPPLHYECVRKDGSIFWGEVKAILLRDSAGRPVGIQGILRDITDRKRAEDALRFTQFAVDRAPVAVTWMGSDGSFLYVNDEACRALGYSRDEMLRMTVHNVDPDVSPETWPEFWEKLKQEGSRTIQARRKTKDDRIFPVEIVANYLEYDGREYACAFARDITQQRQIEEELRAQSLRDQLTSLYNRRGFFTFGQAQLRLADRLRKKAVLLFVDLDDMKYINDTFGHPTGDLALKEVAGVLEKTFRKPDVVARIGGDEFAVLAMETSEIDGELLVERLRRNLAACNGHENRSFGLSVSIGLAHYPPHAPLTLEDLLYRADELMYRDKCRSRKK